ncbi:hypothetical protein FM106_09575 [Brachybacterium faecium]|nr:hypothetical protein FM106_09575 [Brachybacterium faecium]
MIIIIIITYNTRIRFFYQAIIFIFICLIVMIKYKLIT